MKLLHVTGSLSRDGGGVHSALMGLLPAQQSAGLNVTLHGLADGHWPIDRGGWGDLAVRAHTVRGPATFGYAPTLLSAALAERPDIIHCHGLWRYSSLVSDQLSRRLDRPRVVSAHGMLNAAPLAVAPWRKRLAVLAYEGRHVRGATMVHALSDDEARSVRRFGYRGPICVIPNGVTVPATDRIRGALGPDQALGDDPTRAVRPPPWSGKLPDGLKVVLYLGRKDPIKNLPALLDAWELLLRAGKVADDWGLVIAGWGNPAYEALLQARIAAVSPKRVLGLGPLYGEEKDRALAAASAFVLVSRSEALPMAALEAAGWSLPLVLTPACRLEAMLNHGAAIGVNTDPRDISRGLSDLMMLTANERRAMGARGRELVDQTFSWARITSLHLEALQWLGGAGARPSFIVPPRASPRTLAAASLKPPA